MSNVVEIELTEDELKELELVAIYTSNSRDTVVGQALQFYFESMQNELAEWLYLQEEHQKDRMF